MKNCFLRPYAALLYTLRKHYLVSCLLALFSLQGWTQPVVTSFAPASGPVGTSVIINGSGFGTTPSENIVYLGAVKATVTAASATTLSVTVPSGASYQPLSVTTGGLTGYAATPFIVTFEGGGRFSAISFSEPVNFPTDLHPHIMALADLDGDGKPDLATANNYSTNGSPASISLLRNTGSSGVVSFAPKQDISTGVQTNSIAAGDLDGDGKPELVSTSIADNTVSVFRNTSTIGNISFAPKTDLATGNFPASVAIADLDADGRPDLVLINSFSSTISVFKNTSSGGVLSFAARMDFDTAPDPSYLAVSDIDGDGKLDLAVTHFQSKRLIIFKNTSTNGNITFAVAADLSSGTDNPYSVAAGDLDGDNKPDLVITNYNYTSLDDATVSFSLFRNTSTAGSVSMAARMDYYGLGDTYIAGIGDLNGDGKPDVILPHTGGAISVYENNGTPGRISLLAPYGYYSSSPHSIVTGDLDGDGKTDMAACNFTGEAVSVFRNRVSEPVITSFTPDMGPAGDTITISGYNFTGATAVTFGGVPAASFTVVSTNTITAVVGPGATGAVSVTTPKGTGSKDGFTFGFLPPVVREFSPTLAITGATITITGDHLDRATAVSFGGVPAASFTVVSAHEIRAVVGSGASGAVTVTTLGGTSYMNGFVYFPAPTITSIIPPGGGPGIWMSILGDNFWDGSHTPIVTIGGVRLKNVAVYSNKVLAVLIDSLYSGEVTVTTISGTASYRGFNLPPVINSYAPQTITPGAAITLSGRHFTAATAVSFGGTSAASFTVVNDSTLTAVVGAGASGDITVTTYGGTATLAGFLLTPLPRITSFAPETGPIGAPVTIQGENFSSVPSENIVYFGAVKATVTAASATSLEVTVPVSATLSPLTVTTHYATAYSTHPFRLTLAGGSAPLNAHSLYWTLSVPVGEQPTRIAPTDADGDGRPDLVSANFYYPSTTSLVRNTSTPESLSFAPQAIYPTGDYSYDLAVADLNGDGLQDAIVANQGRANFPLSIFPNTSTPGVASFGQRVDCGLLGPEAVAVGDLDGDGRPDLAAACNNSASTVAIVRNTSTNGVLSMSPVSYNLSTGDIARYIAITDLDGDGKPDIIVANAYLFSVSVFRNLSTIGKIAFAPKVDLVTNVSVATFSTDDLDGDGRPDLALCNVSPAGVELYKNTSTMGSISFAPKTEITSGQSPRFLALGDLNGDGKADLAVSDSTAAFSLFENRSASGTLVFGPRIIVPYGVANGLTVCDWNGDGENDIAITRGGSVEILQSRASEEVVALCAHEAATFSAPVSGTTYQWQLNTGSGFTDITADTTYSGTAAHDLRITNASTSLNNYKYRCVVDGTADSKRFNLTVNPMVTPAVSVITWDATICSGNRAAFTAQPVYAGISPAYQWQVNGSNAGGNSPLYSSTTLKDSDKVKVILTTADRCVTSSTASSNTVIMKVNPVIKPTGFATAPSSVCINDSITITFTAGSAPAGTIVELWENTNGSNFGARTRQVCEGSPLYFRRKAESSPLTHQYFFLIAPSSSTPCGLYNRTDTTTTEVGQLTAPVISLANNTLTITNFDAAVTYQWQVLGTDNTWNDVVPAASGDSYTTTVGGTYRVQAKKGGCSQISNTRTLVITALNPVAAAAEGVHLYPNPTGGRFTIDALKASDHWQTLEILSPDGKQKIATYSLKGLNSVQVDLQGVPGGAYIALLRRRSGVPAYIKLVKL